ncbi:MAG: hypothetical protein N2255_10375 [Kiritimatiellae bacterium]|nr:hypothetical protein [Kiritimatiellia bacterium]
MVFLNTRKGNLLTVGILAVAAALRLWNFGSIAPVNSDEATYLWQARFIATLGRKALGLEVPVVAPEQRGIWRHVRKSDWSEKPCWLHTAFMAIPMLFLGPSDATGAVTNIFFALGGVFLTLVVARRLFIPEGPAVPAEVRRVGELSALVAAVLLALSFYWLLYSRGFWAEVDGTFFVLCAFYLLCRGSLFGHTRLLVLVLTGVTSAVAVLCHYRLLYVIGPVTLIAAIWTGRKTWPVAVVAVLVGFIASLLLAAGVLRLIARLAGEGVPFTGLLGALRERYFPAPGGVEQKGFQPANLHAYGWYFVRNMGIGVSILVMAGLTCLTAGGAAKTKRAVAGAALLAIAPFLVLIFQVWVVARAIVVAVPFVCILAGYGFGSVWRLTGCSAVMARVLVILMLLGAVAENLVADIRLIRNRMGHKVVAEFLQRENPPLVYADRESAIIYGWYAPELRYEDLRALEQATVPEPPVGACVVFDAQKWHTYPARRKRVTRLEAELALKSEHVLSVPNLTTAWREFLLDGTQAHSLRAMLESVKKAAEAGDFSTIRVYRLKSVAQQEATS